MSERRKRCEEIADKIDLLLPLDVVLPASAVPILEAFAKKQQLKGMETVRAEFERRKRHIRKSMLDIMFLKWIDAEIAKLKEGG